MFDNDLNLSYINIKTKFNWWVRDKKLNTSVRVSCTWLVVKLSKGWVYVYLCDPWLKKGKNDNQKLCSTKRQHKNTYIDTLPGFFHLFIFLFLLLFFFRIARNKWRLPAVFHTIRPFWTVFLIGKSVLKGHQFHMIDEIKWNALRESHNIPKK